MPLPFVGLGLVLRLTLNIGGVKDELCKASFENSLGLVDFVG